MIKNNDDNDDCVNDNKDNHDDGLNVNFDNNDNVHLQSSSLWQVSLTSIGGPATISIDLWMYWYFENWYIKSKWYQYID